ncbi:hypothetical protein Tco_0295985 [Tanacetum coccineum]
MTTIHVKFDELTTMASEHSCLEPEINCFNVEDSSAESNQTPSSKYLDDLFGPFAPRLVSTSEEPTSPITNDVADESIQEDTVEVDRNTFIKLFCSLVTEDVESYSTNQDPSNMHEFNQLHPSTHTWTKAHLLKQVIGNKSEPVVTRSKLKTDTKVCMHTLTMSTTEPKHIKEAMQDHSRIESMQDELHQFQRLNF